jgi:hypothetical protein
MACSHEMFRKPKRVDRRVEVNEDRFLTSTPSSNRCSDIGKGNSNSTFQLATTLIVGVPRLSASEPKLVTSRLASPKYNARTEDMFAETSRAFVELLLHTMVPGFFR